MPFGSPVLLLEIEDRGIEKNRGKLRMQSCGAAVIEASDFSGKED